MQRNAKKINCTRCCVYLDILPQHANVIKFLTYLNTISIREIFFRKSQNKHITNSMCKTIEKYYVEDIVSIDRKNVPISFIMFMMFMIMLLCYVYDYVMIMFMIIQRRKFFD